jgi:cellobiose phosphorylase
MMDRREQALAYIRRLIPLGKDPMQTRSEPYVLVNFYNGGHYPRKAGEGGIPWLTSTVSWLAMILFDHVFPKNMEL